MGMTWRLEMQLRTFICPDLEVSGLGLSVLPIWRMHLGGR
jgi:hypothetical protein